MSDEWINNLKPGDKVYVRGGGLTPNQMTLTQVIKITLKGAIKIESGSLFKNGSHKIDSWRHEYLVEYTPELEAKNKAEAHYNYMCHTINAQDMRGKPLNQVQRIYDILKGELI